MLALRGYLHSWRSVCMGCRWPPLACYLQAFCQPVVSCRLTTLDPITNCCALSLLAHTASCTSFYKTWTYFRQCLRSYRRAFLARDLLIHFYGLCRSPMQICIHSFHAFNDFGKGPYCVNREQAVHLQR